MKRLIKYLLINLFVLSKLLQKVRPLEWPARDSSPWVGNERITGMILHSKYP
jgi:hypothetical protein